MDKFSDMYRTFVFIFTEAFKGVRAAAEETRSSKCFSETNGASVRHSSSDGEAC